MMTLPRLTKPQAILISLAFGLWSFFVACSAETSAGGGPDLTVIGIGGAGTGQGQAAAGSGGYSGGSGGSGGVTTTFDIGGAVSTGTGGVEGVPNTDVCGDITVRAKRLTPWVFFVIDRSSTMSEAYPGSTSRWDAVRDALMAPNEGVIAKLESMAYFGVMLYDGTDPCPTLITVPPKLNNYKDINAVYGPAFTGIRTPTALALTEAYKMVPTQKDVLDNPGLASQFVVLCTDGEPNGCDMGEDFEGPRAAVTAAAAKAIKTYVISVASGGQQYQDYLEELAAIGNTGSKAFSPATKDELVAQLSKIVTTAVGCQLKLNGKVTESGACRGGVYLNSEKLECGGADGWKYVDETHIELQGKACEKFQGDIKVELSATFPCDVVDVE